MGKHAKPSFYEKNRPERRGGFDENLQMILRPSSFEAPQLLFEVVFFALKLSAYSLLFVYITN